VDPHDVLLAIGRHGYPNRFYETKFDKATNESTITQRIKTRPGVANPRAIAFKMRGDVTPVLVRNSHEILFIGDNPLTDHFGPLIYRFNGKIAKIEDSALWFLPLRTAKK
jgi:hypothetical protein